MTQVCIFGAKNNESRSRSRSEILPPVQTTHAKTHSLFLPVDRLEHGWAGQLEHGRW